MNIKNLTLVALALCLQHACIAETALGQFFNGLTTGFCSFGAVKYMRSFSENRAVEHGRSLDSINNGLQNPLNFTLKNNRFQVQFLQKRLPISPNQKGLAVLVGFCGIYKAAQKTTTKSHDLLD